MDAPNVKTVKVYAVVESTIELPCEDLEEFLHNKRFSGTVTVAYGQGGIRTVVTKEHIPLTMTQLDTVLPH